MILARDKNPLRQFILIVAFVVGSLSILTWDCFAASANLKFSILLDKNEFATGEPINVNFKLENKGKVPIYVNRRFYLNAEDMPKKDREVHLIVTSPSGVKLPCKFHYETGLPKSDYFELLEPGKEVVSEWKRDLRGYFDFNEQGTYKIVAVYENAYGQEIGLDVFREKITLAPVVIKITKPVNEQTKTN